MNKTVNYKAGDLVLESGQFGKGFCILKSGILEVKKGSTVITEISSGGAIFGEMSEILGKPRYVDVYAKTESSVLQVGKPIEDIATTNPEITIKLIKTLARRLEDTTAKLAYDLSEEVLEEKKKQIKVLIVEDQVNVADTIGQKLAHTGWDFTFARSSERAIEYCGRDQFNTIIISMGLPNEGAFSLRRALRSMKKSESTPMIALVITGDNEISNKARQYGFNRQVNKPLDYLELESNIYQAMGKNPTERFFRIEENTSICTLPEEIPEFIFESFMDHMEDHIRGAVNQGLSRIIIDCSEIIQADLKSADIIHNFVKDSEKLKMNCLVVCKLDAVPNWKGFEKIKSLEFLTDLQEALSKPLSESSAEPNTDPTPAPSAETNSENSEKSSEESSEG